MPSWPSRWPSGRAFPAFSYDAAAGSNWAERFSLENNPQPEADWPVERFEYADTALQRTAQDCAFTFADFMLCDPRQAAPILGSWFGPPAAYLGMDVAVHVQRQRAA